MNHHSRHIAVVNELSDGFIVGKWRVLPKTCCLVSTLDGGTIRRSFPIPGAAFVAIRARTMERGIRGLENLSGPLFQEII